MAISLGLSVLSNKAGIGMYATSESPFLGLPMTDVTSPGIYNDYHGSGYLGMARCFNSNLYTDDFLSQMKCHILAQEIFG